MTALYEVVPTRVGGSLGTFALRWKKPEGEVSEDATYPLTDAGGAFEKATSDFRFASAVAAFGLLLRGSANAGDATIGWVVATATLAAGEDARRQELVKLAKTAEELSREEGHARAPDDQLASQLAASSTSRQGYRFQVYKHPDGKRWIATASPEKPMTTGDRWFVTNHEGGLYYSSKAPFALDPECKIPADALRVGK